MHENLIQKIKHLWECVGSAGIAPRQANKVKYAEGAGADALVILSVTEQINGRIAVKFCLLDTIKQLEVTGQSITARPTHLCAIDHRIADIIYEKLSGDAGRHIQRTHCLYQPLGQNTAWW